MLKVIKNSVIVASSWISCIYAGAQPPMSAKTGTDHTVAHQVKSYWLNPARTSKAYSRKQPVLGNEVLNIPRKSSEIRTGAVSCHYKDGIFYYPKGLVYFTAPGPKGARVPNLPQGYATLIAGDTPYFYFYGTFYVRRGVSVYEIVAPPPGAVVYDLPLGFEKAVVGNTLYYRYGDTYFRAITDSYGEVAYEVAEDITTQP